MVTCYSEVDDRVWKALADGKRRKILDTLKQDRKSTGEIVSLFPNLGRTSVLKHIKVLEDVNLITVHREGRVRWNYANPLPIEKTCSPWIEKQIEGLVSSILQLKTLAENPTGKD